MSDRSYNRDFTHHTNDDQNDERDYFTDSDRSRDRFYDRGGYRQDEYNNRSGFGRAYDEFSGQRYEESDWNTPRGYGASRRDDWRVPGPFSGVGPSGYTRSDDRIREELNDRLTLHGRIDARQIDVRVENGEVTLMGMVNSKQEKRLAEDLAETIFGVRDVHNQLRVQHNTQQIGAEQSSFTGGQLREGMNVGDRDGHFIGTVKEIRGHEFLIDRPLARDLWVPSNTARIAGGQIVLNILADEIEHQGWRTAEIA